MTPNHFDPLQAFAFLLAGMGLSAATTAATLPYIGAIIAAIAGAYAAVVNRPKDDLLSVAQAIHFVVSRVLVSSLVSVSLAAIIERLSPGFGLRWTVIPVAMVLAYVGPKEVIQQAWGWLLSILPKQKGQRDES